MILTLIGMSGAGKSLWSQRLAGLGFAHIDCDRLIAERLSQRTGVVFESLESMGSWMGMPYDPGFAEREAHYFSCEVELMREIVEQLDRADATQPQVIDTSGSAIYVDAPILQRLRRRSTVVYLTIPPETHQQMIQTYIQSPRPVIWGGMFQQAPHESRAAALERCYTALIRAREARYQALGHLALDYRFYRQPGLTAEGFLELIHATRRLHDSQPTGD